MPESLSVHRNSDRREARVGRMVKVQQVGELRDAVSEARSRP